MTKKSKKRLSRMTKTEDADGRVEVRLKLYRNELDKLNLLVIAFKASKYEDVVATAINSLYRWSLSELQRKNDEASAKAMEAVTSQMGGTENATSGEPGLDQFTPALEGSGVSADDSAANAGAATSADTGNGA